MFNPYTNKNSPASIAARLRISGVNVIIEPMSPNAAPIIVYDASLPIPYNKCDLKLGSFAEYEITNPPHMLIQ